MATKEVSTWDGLVTALNGFATGDVIKLTADIDLNREYPTGVSSCNITQSSAGSYALTIDGDGHTPPTPLGDAPGPCWPLAPGSSTQARVLARV